MSFDRNLGHSTELRGAQKGAIKSERPILMSGPMVRAILAGTKTQTRRAVKPQSLFDGKDAIVQRFPAQSGCPYGNPNDRLWVRETGWERPERTPRMMREGADTWERYYYDADGLTEADSEDFKRWGFKRRPSIFMPRWASRITLEVTGVRVERLQDISEADCIAEGCEHPGVRIEPTFMPAVYRRVWEGINGPDSWMANPWVWVISFRSLPLPAGSSNAHLAYPTEQVVSNDVPLT